MRSNVFAVIAITALVASLPARAQNWIEFQDLAWGVGINFPHEPVGEDIEYMSSEDRIVPGRVWTAETEGGHYSLTAVFFAATALRAKGTATYDNYHALDGVPGWMMSVTGTDGRLIQSFSLFLNQRLYIAEGSVAPGNPPPSNFQQSITVLNAVGDRIQLNN
jgi:hypothetical protein